MRQVSAGSVLHARRRPADAQPHGRHRPPHTRGDGGDRRAGRAPVVGGRHGFAHQDYQGTRQRPRLVVHSRRISKHTVLVLLCQQSAVSVNLSTLPRTTHHPIKAPVPRGAVHPVRHPQHERGCLRPDGRRLCCLWPGIHGGPGGHAGGGVWRGGWQRAGRRRRAVDGCWRGAELRYGWCLLRTQGVRFGDPCCGSLPESKLG